MKTNTSLQVFSSLVRGASHFFAPNRTAIVLGLGFTAISSGVLHGQVVALSTLGQAVAGSADVFVSGSPGNFTYFHAAQTFTTGSAGGTLSSISVSFAAKSFSNNTFSLRLYSNGSGQPGSLIEALSGSAQPSEGVFTYGSGGSTVLDPNTTYWWVVSSSTNGVILRPEYASSPAVDSGTLPGWTIGNRYSGSIFNSTSLPTFTSAGSTPFLSSVSLVGSPIPEPSSYALYCGFAAFAGVALRRRRRAV